MTKLLTTALCFSLLLCCCKNNDNSDKLSEHYDLSKAPHGQLTDIFSDVEVVPLEFAGNYYPNEIANMSINDSLILITDNLETVYLFEPNGSYISCSSEKQGEGPEEFPFSMGSAWNRYTQNVEILTPYKLMVYDKYFNYIKESKLPTYINNNESFILYNIDSLSDSIHLVRPGVNSNRLIQYNSNTGQLGQEISYAKDVITETCMQENHFFCTDDSITFYVPKAMTNLIYEFNKENLSIKPIVQFSTGSNGMTKQYIDDLNMDQTEFRQHIISCNRDILLNTLPNQSNIINMLKNGSTLRNFYYVFVDRNTGEMTRIDMYRDDQRNMPMFKNIDDEFAYAVALKEDIAEMPWILLNKETDADSILDNIDDDTYVMLKYKF